MTGGSRRSSRCGLLLAGRVIALELVFEDVPRFVAFLGGGGYCVVRVSLLSLAVGVDVGVEDLVGFELVLRGLESFGVGGDVGEDGAGGAEAGVDVVGLEAGGEGSEGAGEQGTELRVGGVPVIESA